MLAAMLQNLKHCSFSDGKNFHVEETANIM